MFVRKEICSAIDSKKVIRFYYRGGTRLLEPYCYGLHRNNGNEVLRGFQVGGYSEFGEPFGWKIYAVDEIYKLEITGINFYEVRGDYNPDDYMMKKIFCRIEKEVLH